MKLLFNIKDLINNIKAIIKNNIKYKRISWTTLLIIVVVTSVFYVSMQITMGINSGLNQGIDRLGADILLLPKEISANAEQTLFTGIPMNIYMPADVLNQVRKLDGVKEATPQFFTQTLNSSCCSLGESYSLVGFEQNTDFLLTPWMDNTPRQSLTEDEVIVGGNVPAFLGDQVVIQGKNFSVAGQLQRTGSRMDNTIFLPLDRARTLAEENVYLKDLWQESNKPEQLISAVLIRVDNPQGIREVAKKLNAVPGVNVVMTSQVLQNIKQQLDFMSYYLIGIQFFLGLIFLGVLLWFGEGIYTIAASIAGVLAGFLLTGIAKPLLAKFTIFSFVWAGFGRSVQLGLGIILISLLASFLGVLYAAYSWTKGEGQR